MYLYFDSKGTLLETVNDEALRQYNRDVNTVNVFIEDSEDKDSGKVPKRLFALSYWFELPTGDTLKNDYQVDRDNDLKRKTIPFDRNRDLKYFKYGKTYEFFEIKLPSADLLQNSTDNDNTISYVSKGDVFSSGGLVLMTIQAGFAAAEDSTAVDKWLSLERVAFTVEDAVILPDDTVTGSEFNWLLQKYAFGDYLRPQLVYGKIAEATNELETANFNRTPIVGEKFLYVYTYYSSAYGNPNVTELKMGTVESVTDDVTTASYSVGLTLTGPRGTTGDAALVYTELLNFTIEKGKTYTVSQANFNRDVDKGETFIAYSNKSQYATFEITEISSTTSALTAKALEVVSTAGKVLFYNDIIVTTKAPSSSDRYTVSADKFNDVPVDGDYALIKMKYGTRTFLAVALIYVNDITTYAYVSGTPLETTGAQGPTGAKIVSTVLTGQDTDGGNIYRQTFDDDSTATFTAPKGPQGLQGLQGGIGPQGEIGEPALVYSKQVNAATISKIFLINSNFNHEPTIGEACLVVWIETDSNDTYLLSSVIKDKVGNQYHLDETKTDSVKITGPIGPMGAVFTPTVSEEGVLSWTNNGGYDNPESINIKGAQGPTGAKIVSTTLTGQDANGGNVYLQTFDDDSTATFTAPKGSQGKTGETGPTGNEALEFDGILEIDNPLKIEDFLQDGSYSFDADDYADNFNRTPAKNDSFLALAKYTYSPYNVFLVSAYIKAPTSAYSYIKIAKYCDVSGQVGPRGAEGIGIETVAVTATTTEEEYTTTTVTLTKTDSSKDTIEIKAKNGVNPNTVSYIGTALVSDWSDSTVYSAYGYKYSALLPFTSGVYATDTYVPDVVPSVIADIVSGNFAPFANSTTAGVEVYAKTKPTATTNFNVSLSHVQ